MVLPIPLIGDRATRYALNYPLLHADDINGGTDAIHHSLGGGTDEAARGNHSHNVEDLLNVDITSAVDGDALVWDDGSNKWINAAVAGGTHSHNLNDLLDVSIAGGSLVDGDALVWDAGLGQWTNGEVAGGTGGGGGHTIEDEGTPLTQRAKLNFVGSAVTVSDHAGSDETRVTIIGGGDHTHGGVGDGGQLDWDDIWTDAIHNHSSGTEGGTLDASVVGFNPGVLADWDGSADPGKVDDALDQLASRVADLEASLTMVRQTIFTVAGNVSVGGGLLKIYNKLGVTETISQVFLSINTAPTGADLIVDIHKDGTTIFTNQANRPVIAAGATTGFTTTIDVSSWADGSYLTCHIDQVGSTITGANLVVHVLHS